jgi:hypothetical protein
MSFHAFYFPDKSLGMSLGRRLYLTIIMATAHINFMPRLDAPSVAPASIVAKAKSFRDACRVAWENRRVANMTRAGLCERTGMRPSHVAEYISDRDLDDRGVEMRDMPAKYIPAFEEAVGNTFISQWLAMQAQLTILEAQIAEQKVVACK